MGSGTPSVEPGVDLLTGGLAVADANILLGYELGREVSGTFVVLPDGLNDPTTVARFVDELDKPLFVDGEGHLGLGPGRAVSATNG